ncbi:MAG: class I SAM-dependent methyltransferase [Pseudolabrys sp.]|nr:class I SAM-dependent methyltransferase [Pseudolabrys sp.]
MDWISFYDFKHSVIYVNGRHRDVHYQTIAKDIRVLVPSPDAIVMDYGCGEATSAALVAEACQHLTLVEAAPNVRAALRERYAANPKMSVMNPDEAAKTPDGTVDMIVLHSVAQYLTADELKAMMTTFHRLLKPTGTFVLGDIVPPQMASVWAALSLLKFGAQNGFFWAAVGGLIRILVSDYFTLKKTHGLSHYTEADMLARLRAAGFAPRRAPHNIGHNQHRMTFLSKPV